MTGRIHLLSKPPEHPRHQRCTELLDHEDTLVLTEGALNLLDRPSPFHGISAGRVIALGETLETQDLPQGVEPMDHATFVDRILAQHQPVFW